MLQILHPNTCYPLVFRAFIFWSCDFPNMAMTLKIQNSYRKDICVYDLGGLFSGGLVFFLEGGLNFGNYFTV